MLDNFRSGQRAKFSADFKALPFGKAIEESGGELVARAGCVHDFFNGRSRNADALPAGENDRAFFTARQHGNFDVLADGAHGVLEAFLHVERFDFFLIGEEDVHVVFDQPQEVGTVTIHAKRIGQGERDAVAVLMRHFCGADKGVLGLLAVEQIPFQIGNARIGNHGFVKVVCAQLHAGPQESVHRALGVWRHKDKAAPGFRTDRQRLCVKGDSHGAQIVLEDFSKLVASDFANKAALAAEGCKPGHCVPGRSAGSFHARPHEAVKLNRAHLVDQGHRALFHAVQIFLLSDKVFAGLRQHVNKSISNGNNAKNGFGHFETSILIDKQAVYVYIKSLQRQALMTKKQRPPSSPESEKDRILDAALALAAAQGWGDVTLSGIAHESGLPLAALRAHVEDKTDILALLGRRIDRRTLEASGSADPSISTRDRLFDILMERFDVLNEYRPAILSILESFKCDPKQAVISCPHLARSMNWMLEAAGENTKGLKGALKVAGLTALYIKTLRVWREDESPDLARTMAALDKDLSRAERLAETLGF